VLANRERRGKSGEEKESRGGREVRWRTYAPPRLAAGHHWTCGRRAFLSSVLPASHFASTPAEVPTPQFLQVAQWLDRHFSAHVEMQNDMLTKMTMHPKMLPILK
jgi:hypothetical protein